MIYYTIYKITNKLNRNYYIGSHKTKNLDDGYMGSGNLIKEAVKKYGKENFEKEYLFFAFDNKSLNLVEEELVVTHEQDSKSYNLTVGGNRPPIAKKGRKQTRPKFSSGYDYKHSEETKEKIRKWTIENQPMDNDASRKKISEGRMGMKFSEEHKKNLSLAKVGKPSNKKGKKLSDESKLKMSIARKKYLQMKMEQET